MANHGERNELNGRNQPRLGEVSEDVERRLTSHGTQISILSNQLAALRFQLDRRPKERRFLQVFLPVSISVFAVLITGVLAFQANILSEEQNRRSAGQIVLAESQRRSQYFQAEFADILRGISDERNRNVNDNDSDSDKKEWEKNVTEMRSVILASINDLSGATEIPEQIRRSISENRNLFVDGTRSISVETMQRIVRNYISEWRIVDRARLYEPSLPERAVAGQLVRMIEAFEGVYQEFSTISSNNRMFRWYTSGNPRLSSIMQSDHVPVGDVFFSPAPDLRSRTIGLLQEMEPSPFVSFEQLTTSHQQITGADFFARIMIGHRPAPHIKYSRLSRERAQILLTLISQRVDLVRLFFEGADFSNADLSGRHLRNAVLDFAKLNDSNFRGAHISNGSFHGSSLRCADFSGAVMNSLDLRKTSLRGANFDGAIFSGPVLISPEFFVDVSLHNVDLSRLLLTEEELQVPSEGIPPDITDRLTLADGLRNRVQIPPAGVQDFSGYELRRLRFEPLLFEVVNVGRPGNRHRGDLLERCRTGTRDR